MNLSVVIVNWNGAGLLRDCLPPLEGTGCEVIVVDNGSGDGSIDLLRGSFPWVRTIRNEDNVGFAVANNQGIRAATNGFVLLLNNDTIADARALHGLVGFIERHPRAGIAGPTLVNRDATRQPSCGPEPDLWFEILGKTMLHRVLPGRREMSPDRDQIVGWVTGAALCIRREIALGVGGLDEDIFLFYEDLDLCTRVRDAGWEVWYVRTAPIVHLGGASRRYIEAESLVHSYRSTMHYFARHGPPWRARLIRALTVPEMLLRSLLWTFLALAPGRQDLALERLDAYRRILRLAVGGSERSAREERA